jgi:hypothetical protein
MTRLQQHVVKGKRQRAGGRFDDFCHGQLPGMREGHGTRMARADSSVPFRIGGGS